MKLVLATHNKGKIREFQKVFSEIGWEAVLLLMSLMHQIRRRPEKLSKKMHCRKRIITPKSQIFPCCQMTPASLQMF